MSDEDRLLYQWLELQSELREGGPALYVTIYWGREDLLPSLLELRFGFF